MAKLNGDSMPKIILITGGAGFIGSHLADDLLQHGYRVRVLDNVSPQVHADAAPPAYLCGDVRSGARRVGQEGVSPGRSRWRPSLSKKKQKCFTQTAHNTSNERAQS